MKIATCSLILLLASSCATTDTEQGPNPDTADIINVQKIAGTYCGGETAVLEFVPNTVEGERQDEGRYFEIGSLECGETSKTPCTRELRVGNYYADAKTVLFSPEKVYQYKESSGAFDIQDVPITDIEASYIREPFALKLSFVGPAINGASYVSADDLSDCGVTLQSSRQDYRAL